MPPFFFRDAARRRHRRILRRADRATRNPPRNGILLYNFPRMSGIAFHPGSRRSPAARISRRDRRHEGQLERHRASKREVLARHPGLPGLPRLRGDLLARGSRGVAGCVSGSVALWPQLAQRVWTSDDAALAESLSEARSVLDGVSFVPAVRYLTAKARRDETWQRAMPAVVPLPEPQRDTLDRALKMSALERGRQGGRC